MTHKVFGLLFSTCFLILSGCASMSEQECLVVDWQDRGYRDGRDGQPATLLVDHAKACAKVGVVPDTVRYKKGREQGLILYCTPRNAEKEGRLGHRYYDVCPVALEYEFLRSYEDGKRIYDAKQNVEQLNRRSADLERSLDTEKDDKNRRRLRRELRDVDRELSRARDALHYEERRLRY